MPKESLFKHIRCEDVILWAGAGLSLYAGYPSGNKLSEIFYNELSHTEKEYISINLNLQDITEEFYKIKLSNRNDLIRILNKNIRDIEPSSTHVHNLIAQIPHFKNIITTNYDDLFERAYRGKIEKIINSKNIPCIDKNKVHLYKIHGDLSDPESIIITKSDYNTFFSKKD